MDGLHILYKTAIAILAMLQPALLESEFDEIMQILKSTHERITDEEEFIAQIKEVSIPEWIESELP